MVQVRRGELKDLGALVALHEEVHQLHLTARPDQFQTAPDGALAQRFREWLADPNAKVWVAELEAQVVGYAVQLLRQREAHPIVRQQRWWEIDNLGVTAAHRGQGLGTALLRAVIDDADQSDVKAVELASWAFNTAAHRAFTKAGFAPKHIRFERRR